MHESTDVWAIRFDNNDSLGVTGSHPIYSLDANSWVLASTLSTGNQVLTKSGAATVTSVKKLSGSRKVYNLEVRDLHNFLVGRDGVVVHNACWKEALDVVLGKIPISVIWKMKGVPAIFKRGNILEQIARKKYFSKSKGWRYTGIGDGGDGISNFWLIDFYKGDKVVSLKSVNIKKQNGTIMTGKEWASTFKEHIKNLNERKNVGSFPNCNTGFPNCNNPSKTVTGIKKAELRIVVEDLSKIDVNEWKTEIMKHVTGNKSGFSIVISEL